MKFHLPLFALLATVTLAGCHSASAAEVAAEQMDAKIPAQEFSVDYKDYGAFRGQGTACTSLQFADDAFLEQIQEQDVWKPFPLNETTQELVYGVSGSCRLRTPLTDDTGTPLVPEIENGYYMLHEATENRTSHRRHAHELSVSIYDSDNRVLYHCTLNS